MIRLALEQQGFEVIEAADSTDGIDKARQFLPDLILCDVNMDKAGAGYTTLTKLRENAATAAIPFILMTGMADSAGMRHGMELGADDYLPKPFKVDELYAAVNARLRKVKTVRDDAERKLTTLRTHISMMMPHELRTPLNGIISNAELLSTSAAMLGIATITEMGQEICKSGLRLERLIENFLFYARLEIVATDADSVIALRSAESPRRAGIVRPAAISQAEMAGRLPDLRLDSRSPAGHGRGIFQKNRRGAGAERLQVFRTRFRGAGQFEADRARKLNFPSTTAGADFPPNISSALTPTSSLSGKCGIRKGSASAWPSPRNWRNSTAARLAISSSAETGTTVTVKLPRPNNGADGF